MCSYELIYLAGCLKHRFLARVHMWCRVGGVEKGPLIHDWSECLKPWSLTAGFPPVIGCLLKVWNSQVLPSGSSRHFDHTSCMLLKFCSFSSIFWRKSVNRSFTWGLTSSCACLATLIDLINLLPSLSVTRCSGVISLTQLVCMSSMSSAAFVSGDTFTDISCWCSFTVWRLDF